MSLPPTLLPARFWSLHNPWLFRLAGLTVVVFLVHLALLNKASLALNLPAPKPTLAFTTRTIEPVTAPPAVESAPPTDVKPQPIPKPKSKPTKRLTPASVPRETTVASAETTPTPTPTPTPAPASAPLAPSEPMPTPTAALPQPTTPAAADPVVDSAPQVSGPQPAAFAALTSAKYTYRVDATKKGLDYKGSAELTWRQDGENYDLTMTASALGFRVFRQNSVGRLSPQGLLPKRHSDQRGLGSEKAVHFDYIQNIAIFSNNKPEASLAPSAQDRLSYVIQLAGLLAADPAKYPPNTTINMQAVGMDDAQPWLFTVNEPETLNLSAGPQIGLRLTRNPRYEYDVKIEVWFAPALNYLPVRIRQTESNGDYFDTQFVTSESLPNTVSP